MFSAVRLCLLHRYIERRAHHPLPLLLRSRTKQILQRRGLRGRRRRTKSNRCHQEQSGNGHALNAFDLFFWFSH